MILFLDFDGVLHPEPCPEDGKFFCNLSALEAILRDFPAVEIVISSMWRFTHTQVELQALFSADIAERIVGVTPDRCDVSYLFPVVGSYVHHAEIEGWLRQSDRAREPWLALDDSACLFKPFLPNLIRCDPRLGLDRTTGDLLREKLKQLC